jgi:hypothetical protein
VPKRTAQCSSFNLRSKYGGLKIPAISRKYGLSRFYYGVLWFPDEVQTAQHGYSHLGGHHIAHLLQGGLGVIVRPIDLRLFEGGDFECLLEVRCVIREKASTAVGARCHSWCGYCVGGEKIMRDAARAGEDGYKRHCSRLCVRMQNGLPRSSCD